MKILEVLKFAEATIAAFLVYVGLLITAWAIGGPWLGIPSILVAADIAAITFIVVSNYELLLVLNKVSYMLRGIASYAQR